jgi:hypothetical protein
MAKDGWIGTVPVDNRRQIAKKTMIKGRRRTIAKHDMAEEVSAKLCHHGRSEAPP